jgi:hypothetical protein
MMCGGVNMIYEYGHDPMDCSPRFEANSPDEFLTNLWKKTAFSWLCKNEEEVMERCKNLFDADTSSKEAFLQSLLDKKMLRIITDKENN